MAVFNRSFGCDDNFGVWQCQPGRRQALGELPTITMKRNNDRCQQAGPFYSQSFRKNQTEVSSKADNLRCEECMRSAQALTDGDRMNHLESFPGPTLAF